MLSSHPPKEHSEMSFNQTGNKDEKPAVTLSGFPDGGVLRIRDNTNKTIFSAPQSNKKN